jgi:RNA-directed DNA polymerase
MSREVHVRFCEGLGVRLPRATRLVILVRSSDAAWKVMASVSRFVTRKLKLVVNETKSAVRRADGADFLGFAFRTRKANIAVTAKNLLRLQARVREITSRNRGISFHAMVQELSRYLRGWMGYFGLSSTKRIWSPLDGWIRRRVRMYLWKQWRLPRTRIRSLLQLGVDRKLAITHGASRKGYWRLSKTLGGHCGMTKLWLRDQGLVFLRYLWGDLAPLRRTA